MPQTINLAEKFRSVARPWTPMILGAVNECHVKIAKLEGEFIWHHHEQEDELFLVLKGTLRMEFRDHTETVGEGEMIIVPRGVEHRPVAEGVVQVLLFEPAATLNTGNVRNDRTVDRPAWG